MQNINLKKKLVKKTYEYYNALSVSYTIKKIINYNLYFLTIESTDSVELNLNYKQIIENINDDYIMIKYDNINSISLIEYVNNEIGPNEIGPNEIEINKEIIKIIESYKLILKNIEVLLLNKIE